MQSGLVKVLHLICDSQNAGMTAKSCSKTQLPPFYLSEWGVQSFHLNPIASNISCNDNQSFRDHNLFSYKLETCYKGLG